MQVCSCLQGFPPGNDATLSHILTSCTKSSQWQTAYKAWSMLQSTGTVPTSQQLAALMMLLRDVGQWQAVLSIHQAMSQAKAGCQDCLH